MHVCMYVCMYVYIYIFKYLHLYMVEVDFFWMNGSANVYIYISNKVDGYYGE